MEQKSKIAVAGATGRVGRHVVEVLEARGHPVVAMSRSRGVDLVTGEGVAQALAGVQCIIDAATGNSPDEKTATDFFTAAARNLQEAGERAGVRRMVVVSIIGIDRFTGGYQAAKLAHEKIALAGPIPATILRAAQFHEFVGTLMDWGRRDDAIYVPRMRTQLVAARSVAEALVDMALAPDAVAEATSRGPIPEIAGPRPENLVDAARLLAARRGERVRIEEVSDPSDPASELYEAGVLLPGPHATLAGPTFAEWLDRA
jgi:uncharacterized protein YbjT (DUF2867 family)